MPKPTRKHFKRLADTIAFDAKIELKDIEKFTRRVAPLLKELNPSFSEERFREYLTERVQERLHF